MLIRVKRGLEAGRLSITPNMGEPLFTTDTKKLYIGDGVTPGGIAVDLGAPPAPVQSVAGRQGVVVLDKTDVGLGNLDNTSDANKPISTATQTALDAKQPLDTTLTSLAAYNTNGILTQTAADTFTGRTITGTANQVTVTNGDGVSGNPTLALPNAITLPGTLTITGHTSPQADSTYTLGTSSLYWKETYTDKLFLNSTATLDGSTAGTVAITGNVTSTGTGSFTTVTAGTTTDVLGTALTVIRNNVAVGRLDNNASGLRVQAQTGTLQLRGTGNTGIAVGSTGKATFASDIEFSDTASGVILKSPDGTLYRVTVANGGTLAVAAV